MLLQSLCKCQKLESGDLCKIQASVEEMSVRVSKKNPKLLMIRRHCSLSTAAVFVFFMDFLRRFLSPTTTQP